MVPIVPVVVVVDGWTSCLRTRTRGEILELMEGIEGVDRVGWKFESGSGVHSWPTGEATWFVGVKER